MKISTTGGAEGFLKIYKVQDGERELLVDEKNLIVDAAKAEHLRFLWDVSAVPDIVNSFKVGDGGSLDTEGLFPKTEDPLQTDLHSPLMTSTNITVATPTADSVLFTFDVLTSEANGTKINEVGLFKISGSIFNVKNFIAIPKTSAFSLHFEWIIRYA